MFVGGSGSTTSAAYTRQPNHSIERTYKGVPPMWAAHVKRSADDEKQEWEPPTEHDRIVILMARVLRGR